MLRLLLLILMAQATWSQVQFSVDTDSSHYAPGAPIGITGTVTNISGESVTLYWNTGCQFNYYLGGWASYMRPGYGCTTAQTWVTLDPAGSHNWDVVHNPEDTSFAPGDYAVVGFLNEDEFRLTAPTFLTIGDTEDPYYKTGYAPPADSMLLTNGGCTPAVLVPHLEHVTDDLDLVWINAVDNSWYVYTSADTPSMSPYPWGASEFYFYIRDTLDYSYELLLLNQWENLTLHFETNNFAWVDGACTYRLLLSHENVVVDSIDYHFQARMTASIDPGEMRPALLKMEAYPSPFNPTTSIAFELQERADVELNIFDLAGRQVWSTRLNPPAPGHYEVTWNGQNQVGANVPSGVYIVQLAAGPLNESIKVVLLK